jgi:hypothetical protein
MDGIRIGEGTSSKPLTIPSSGMYLIHVSGEKCHTCIVTSELNAEQKALNDILLTLQECCPGGGQAVSNVIAWAKIIGDQSSEITASKNVQSLAIDWTDPAQYHMYPNSVKYFLITLDPTVTTQQLNNALVMMQYTKSSFIWTGMDMASITPSHAIIYPDEKVIHVFPDITIMMGSASASTMASFDLIVYDSTKL